MQRLEADEPSADQARLDTEQSRDDPDLVPRRRERALRHDPPGRLEEEVAGTREAAADHDELRIEDVHEASNAHAEVEADVIEHLAGIAGTVRGELDGEARVDGLALGSRAPEISFGILLGGRPRIAVCGRARCQRLEVAASGTAALAGRAVEVECDVAELGRGADRAAVEIAVEDESAADPVPSVSMTM